MNKAFQNKSYSEIILQIRFLECTMLLIILKAIQLFFIFIAMLISKSVKYWLIFFKQDF